jgi:hypothetical protein
MVNDHLVCFDKVLEMILNNSLNMILSPNFIKPSPKKANAQTHTYARGRQRTEKFLRGRPTKSKRSAFKNAAPIMEFLMKDNEVWKRVFMRIWTGVCPKWDKNTFMCARWYIRGIFFHDCNNKASHVGACIIPLSRTNSRLTMEKFAKRTQPHI